MEPRAIPITPLLKWAGGKRQLLPRLREYYPDRFERYVEPFLGSGAVFFDLYNQGRLADRRVRLVDANPDLVGCYRTLRDRADAVIKALHALSDEHRRRGDACYYEVRDGRFNPIRAGRAGGAGGAGGAGRAGGAGGAGGDYTPELAAMLIYLNRTGFNGLFRLNRRGEFNVPAGRYVNPRICDPEHLRGVAAALRAPGVTLECASFDETLGDAGPGDFVYCDPPYAPLSRTASFASYTAGGFSWNDQLRLRNAVIGASARRALVVVSNSSAALIERAYGDAVARAAKLAIYRVSARRAINSRAANRGPIDELIITNVPAASAGLKNKTRPSCNKERLRMARVDMPARRKKSA